MPSSTSLSLRQSKRQVRSDESVKLDQIHLRAGVGSHDKKNEMVIQLMNRQKIGKSFGGEGRLEVKECSS